jgi:tRNA threonylcarbamoyl adenosine modification protein YeaZ
LRYILYFDVNILAVDTSTLRLGIGIVAGSSASFDRRWSEEGHSAPLFGRIEFAMNQIGLNKSDIDLLAVVSGPGSFTGLRIGMAGILGWAVSSRLPVLPIDSFSAMRASLPDSLYPVLIAIHSRGDDFYMQYLSSPDAAESARPFIGTVESLAGLPADRCRVCGPGAAKLLDLLNENQDRFEPAGGAFDEPDMEAVCHKAEKLAPECRQTGGDYKIEPYYMTLSQAQINFESRERRL